MNQMQPPGWRPSYPPQQQQYPQQQQGYSYPPPQQVQVQQPYPSYPPPSHWPQQQHPQGYVQDNRGLSFAAVPAHFYERGKNLVFWSRMILLAACLLSFGGCGLMIGGPDGARGVFGIGLLVGVCLFVVAAIVGTIGRRFQGRII